MKVYFSLILAIFTAMNAQGASCPAAVYSVKDKQATFPFLAVEVYTPINSEPLKQRYVLCTAQGGTPVKFIFQAGYDEFYFSYLQTMECTDQLIEEQENCYPTYLASQSMLTFPEIKIPWVVVLPNGAVLSTQELCYKASLTQKKRQPNSFLLTKIEETVCQ